MSDEAKVAIANIKVITQDVYAYGSYAHAKSLRSAAETLESELRRCRAETLREAAEVVKAYFVAENAAEELEGMASQAEREANHDA